MATDELVQVALLSSPLSGGNPGGQDLRWDTVYDEIKKSRTEGDRHILEGGEEKEADWPRVIDLTTEVLSSRSKDLMVAAWLTEALMVRHGFAGLRDGLRVVRGLLDQCWDCLYPQLDGDDLELRVAPIAWLMDADRGGKIPNRMRDIPLMTSTNNNEDRLSWTYWKSRYCAPKGSNESDEAYAERQMECARREKCFEDALQSTPLERLVAVSEDLKGVREAFQELDRISEQRFGRLAPGVSAFRSALDEIGALVRRLVRDKGGEGGEPGEAEPAAGANGSQGAARGGSTGPIQSREDAFRRMAEAAEFLRRTEPQSPIPLLIDRAISWGRMPFAQLLREIVRDTTARDQVRELLGIEVDNSASEG